MWPYQNQNKKKQKQQNKNTGVVITYNRAVVKPKRIFDKVDKTNIGVLYWNQETLEELTKLSGPLAKSNEYQIHYWSLLVIG